MSIRLHTPGPWTVDYSDDNLRIYAGDLLIGEVNGSTEHIEVRGLDEEATEANAWLIAAAPDLLAALERTLKRVPLVFDALPTGWAANAGERATAAVDETARKFHQAMERRWVNLAAATALSER